MSKGSDFRVTVSRGIGKGSYVRATVGETIRKALTLRLVVCTGISDGLRDCTSIGKTIGNGLVRPNIDRETLSDCVHAIDVR
jgi:hypothetical protein